jgi:pimeloyl-ACP methyl ester carboxylesterase
MRITRLLRPLARTASPLSVCGIALLLLGAHVSCSEDTPAPLGSTSGDGGVGDAAVATLDTPSAPCTDAADAVYGDPGALSGDPTARGDIVKCATDPLLTKEAMQTKLTELGFAGKPLSTNARVYRVSYKTQRGDAASSPSVSSAIVYIPETPRAAKLPIVVAARGSRGQAARCAVSKFDAALDGINGDAYRMVYPLVGSGYAVILPDLAGYANFGATKNPPSGYAQATDVARSTLDGSRALKKLFPALDDKVVLVGHSQGGHSALAALALYDSYGAAAPIVGAAVFAPLWLSQRSWGAVINRVVGAAYPIASSPAPNVSVWYHYTQAELLDGPGEGKKLFAADKQDAVKAFIENECWGSTELAKLGTYVDELFDPAFVSDVATNATNGLPCDGNARCQKWIDRYSADRPHLTGTAATTPILLAYGLKDTTIPPARMKCALDRLKEDNVKLTACVDAEQTHGGIVSARGEYVADWIASVALGGVAPSACTANESAITEECAVPPPND